MGLNYWQHIQGGDNTALVAKGLPRQKTASDDGSSDGIGAGPHVRNQVKPSSRRRISAVV